MKDKKTKKLRLLGGKMNIYFWFRYIFSVELLKWIKKKPNNNNNKNTIQKSNRKKKEINVPVYRIKDKFRNY